MPVSSAISSKGVLSPHTSAYDTENTGSYDCNRARPYLLGLLQPPNGATLGERFTIAASAREREMDSGRREELPKRGGGGRRVRKESGRVSRARARERGSVRSCLATAARTWLSAVRWGPDSLIVVFLRALNVRPKGGIWTRAPWLLPPHPSTT